MHRLQHIMQLLAQLTGPLQRIRAPAPTSLVNPPAWAFYTVLMRRARLGG
jgi:hypothetical protein